MTLDDAIHDVVGRTVAEALAPLLAQLQPPTPSHDHEDDTVLTVPELALYLRVGRNAAYALCNSQPAPFPSKKIGGRTVVAKWTVRRWLEEQDPAPIPFTEPAERPARQRKEEPTP